MEPPDHTFVPSETKSAEIVALPADVGRLIADQSDWQTAVLLCRALPGLSKHNYWRNRAIGEFAGQNWLEVYQYDFHNYLATRVRWLYDQIAELKGLKIVLVNFDSEHQLRMRDFGTTFQDLVNAIKVRGEESTVGWARLKSIYLQVRKYELQHEREFPELEEVTTNGNLSLQYQILQVLYNYFHEQEKRDMSEVFIISNFLAQYLKRNFPEDFKVINITLSEEQERHYMCKKTEYRQCETFSVALSQEFVDEFSILPANIIFQTSSQKNIIRIFILGEHNIVCYGSSLSHVVFGGLLRMRNIFQQKMLDLGVIPQGYWFLYPEVFSKRGHWLHD